jgi:hypothetical protein
MGCTPGAGEETPVTPDEPDVLDADGVVEGLGVDTLATGRRVRRVGWWFLGEVLARIVRYS